MFILEELNAVEGVVWLARLVDGGLEAAEDRSKVTACSGASEADLDRVQDRSVMPSWPHHSRSRFNSTVDRFRHISSRQVKAGRGVRSIGTSAWRGVYI